MKIINLRMNGMNEPVGVEYHNLICSWRVTETESTHAERVRIEVSREKNFAVLVCCDDSDDKRLILSGLSRYDDQNDSRKNRSRWNYKQKLVGRKSKSSNLWEEFA